ncbi:MAG: T9SS type A sorting domain-containing protein, partial [Bacteroidales bacterium]|nr:T9SS type A sorting domain-containing protein [Bacteroidales bacterium]
ENINIDGKIDIKIIDILGKKQKELSLYGINSASINISDINQGSYILTISNHKYKHSQIFIKK